MPKIRNTRIADKLGFQHTCYIYTFQQQPKVKRIATIHILGTYKEAKMMHVQNKKYENNW